MLNKPFWDALDECDLSLQGLHSILVIASTLSRKRTNINRLWAALRGQRLLSWPMAAASTARRSKEPGTRLSIETVKYRKKLVHYKTRI